MKPMTRVSLQRSGSSRGHPASRQAPLQQQEQELSEFDQLRSAGPSRAVRCDESLLPFMHA